MVYGCIASWGCTWARTRRACARSGNGGLHDVLDLHVAGCWGGPAARRAAATSLALAGTFADRQEHAQSDGRRFGSGVFLVFIFTFWLILEHNT